jgi:hypothetical protein
MKKILLALAAALGLRVGQPAHAGGRLWNPVAIPIPCLDSFRPLRPRKSWQLPAGSGSTPARIPFQRFIELLQIPLESVFAVILPVIGIARDVILDGAKAVIGTVFVAIAVPLCAQGFAFASP